MLSAEKPRVLYAGGAPPVGEEGDARSYADV